MSDERKLFSIVDMNPDTDTVDTEPGLRIFSCIVVIVAGAGVN